MAKLHNGDMEAIKTWTSGLAGQRVGIHRLGYVEVDHLRFHADGTITARGKDVTETVYYAFIDMEYQTASITYT